MTNITFNRTPLRITSTPMDKVSGSAVQATPVLRRAPLNQAALLGGPILRAILETTPLKGDKQFIFVDTKVSYLMPGWVPSIPGWHTDGVPRGVDGDPAGKGVPDMDLQEKLHAEGKNPRFHTLTVGSVDCPTRFDLTRSRILDVPTKSRELYESISTSMNSLSKVSLDVLEPEDGVWVSWDWYQLHTAIPARSTGWRLLVRVTETDFVKPAAENWIRQQSQVYVPSENVGW